jgi:hypothetical protein
MFPSFHYFQKVLVLSFCTFLFWQEVGGVRYWGSEIGANTLMFGVRAKPHPNPVSTLSYKCSLSYSTLPC